MRTTSKSRPNIPQEFYDAQITLVFGDRGAGKTIYCMNHPNAPDGIFLDFENRYEEVLAVYPWIESENYIQMLQYDKEFRMDPIETFRFTQATVKAITKKEPKPKLVVLDGIQDIRSMAIAYWMETNGKQPATNWRSWAAINELIKDIVYRLINYSRLCHVPLIMTTMEAMEYQDGVPTGKTFIDAKDYITKMVSQILKFDCKGQQFFCKRGKSPYGPTDWVEITQEEMLHDIQ